jgi:hypothetical protein
VSTPPRTDRRPTLTLKGDAFNPEFRTLLNKAAKKAGKTQADYAAEVLAAAARKTLAGTPDDTPADNPVPATIPAEILERQDATDKRLAELADQVRALSELQQRGLWARVRGRFRV